MKERVDIVDFKKEAKRRERKEKIQSKINNVGRWVSDNKEAVLILVPATLGAVTTGVKVVSKHVQRSKEKELKDLYCYDRSLGHYWKLRRELTNSEWAEIDKRKNNGERLGNILEELKVLK